MDDDARQLLTRLDRHLHASDRPAALAALRSLFERLSVQDFALGYEAATVLFRGAQGRVVLSDLIREDGWNNRVKIPEAIARSFPVFLRTIGDGARYGVNPRCFPEERPRVVYCDDVGSRVDELRGLRLVGRAQVKAPPFMWLSDVRDGVLLEVEAAHEGEVSFRSRGVGEFCVEVFHARPDGAYVAVERDDFCFK